MSTELIVIGDLRPLEVFSNNGLDPIIDRIEKEVKAVVLDISTESGRKQIASLAYRIAQSKTALDKMGKDLVSGWKEQARKVDQERARAWDRLEALQKEIRQPLTEWENGEKERVQAHENELVMLGQCATYVELNDLPADQIEGLIAKANEIAGRNWEEFAVRASQTKDDVLARLTKRLEARRKHDAEQAELERLRKEEAERRQREHEERLKEEAAAKARAEAEEKARKAAEAEAARVTAEKERAEQEKLRIQREKEEAEARAKKAEEDRLAAVAKAEADRKAAEEKAARDAEEAVKRERERIEAERKAEAEAAAKREANKRHRAKVNREALAAMVAAGVPEDVGKLVIEAIAKQLVPHVTIQY